MTEQTQQCAEALAAFRRLAMLAVEHYADLDTAARLMSAHAWVGGGAPAFATELNQRRSALQSELSGALHAAADLVVRRGGPTPALPIQSTSISGMSAGPGHYQGIDPAAMTHLISALTQAGGRLVSAGSRLVAELAAAGLSSTAGTSVGQLGSWAESQSGDLRRRLARIQQTVPGLLPGAVAAYGLFSQHATDAGSVATFLAQLAKGDAAVIDQLLALQADGTDAGLAARINAWWRGLTADLQRQLTTLLGFGLLNGLPATVRDQANRRWLESEKQRLTREVDVATKDLLVSGQPLLLGGWESISHQLKRIELIHQQLQPRPGYPPPLLLGFDLTGQGRLIVSWGNPDTADITVTSVSGLSSQLDGVAGDLERGRTLWQQAGKTARGHSAASITWYGYDAPQVDPGLFDSGKSVASAGAAAKGGAALAAFQDGLQAAHEPTATARSVIIGHSYGSLTTGKAAVLRPGRLADDLILVGSPGVGVDHASQLGLDPKHVWVGEAGGDPVAALGRFGADPGHDSFGAQHFPVSRTVVNEAHGSYWDRGSVSLRNMGRIINGQYSEIEHPEPLDAHPQLLMPDLAPDLALKLNR